MSDRLRWIEKAEERALHPLFANRRPPQCCWPLWGDRTPYPEKRTCGAGVLPGSKIPYCPEHLERQRGAGTTGERAAPRALLALTKEGKS